jgi:hypothetical protein
MAKLSGFLVLPPVKQEQWRAVRELRRGLQNNPSGRKASEPQGCAQAPAESLWWLLTGLWAMPYWRIL